MNAAASLPAPSFEEAAQLLNSVEDCCRRLRVGRTSLFKLFSTGQLRAVRVGARTMVTETELRRFVSSLELAR